MARRVEVRSTKWIVDSITEKLQELPLEFSTNASLSLAHWAGCSPSEARAFHSMIVSRWGFSSAAKDVLFENLIIPFT
jgi:hypothetical protein